MQLNNINLTFDNDNISEFVENSHHEKLDLDIYKLHSSFLIIPLCLSVLWIFYQLILTGSLIISVHNKLNEKSLELFNLNIIQNWEFQVFLILLILGAFISYCSLVYLINYKSINFLFDKLLITDGLLPWPGKVAQIHARDIKNCRLERYWAKFDPVNHKFYYRIWVVLKDNKELLLDKEIEKYEDAKNLEQWVKGYLRL